LAIAAVVLVVVRGRATKALGPAGDRPPEKRLPSGRGDGKALAEPEPPRPAKPRPAEGEPSKAAEPAEGPAEPEERPSSEQALEPNADTADEGAALEAGPASDAETADDGPRVPPADATKALGGDGLQGPPGKAPEAGRPADEPRPRKPFFTPPPLPGQRSAAAPSIAPTTAPVAAPARAEAAPAAKPTPAKAASPAVPLPVDKPRAAPDASEAARREQERVRYRQGLQQGLSKTRGGFVAKLARLFKGRPKVDAALRDRIEEVLLTADIGTTTAETLLGRVTRVLDAKEVADPDAVWIVIRQAMLELLELDAPAPDYAPDPGPYVLLMVGVNGVGKTTTLGKLAAQHQRAGRRVLLVAGDTFRAAAVEQLDVWARRVGCEIHRGADKADPSSVIFEGIGRGRREGFDVVLCDTAGRLHTRKELMDELGKVGRAAAKALGKGVSEQRAAEIVGAHDTFLVLDATIGQNALAQAQLFKELFADTTGLTGLVVTKLDGTAKGGVVLGICDELRVPIRYVGIGEGIDDLRAFDAEEFVDALLLDRDRVDEPAA
jgi:fused signal recognition particle receptor